MRGPTPFGVRKPTLRRASRCAAVADQFHAAEGKLHVQEEGFARARDESRVLEVRRQRAAALADEFRDGLRPSDLPQAHEKVRDGGLDEEQPDHAQWGQMTHSRPFAASKANRRPTGKCSTASFVPRDL